MTVATDLLIDSLTRVRGDLHRVLRGVTADDLTFRLDPDANSIAWLVWHLSRVQDDHIASAAGTGQVWVDDDWVTRFGLPFAPDATGYGFSSDDVARVAGVSVELLGGYYDAVHSRSVRWIESLNDEALATVVDDSYDPPVTLGARLVSVVNDDTQHVGQAAFVKGSIRRLKA